MKVIIAGSRSIVDYRIVEEAVRASGFDITEEVSGTAPGVDRLGERWAAARDIPIQRFPANWSDLSHPDAIIKTRSDGSKYDARAGFRRNQQMAGYAEALIAIMPRGGTSGTQDMITRAQKRGLKVYIHEG